MRRIRRLEQDGLVGRHQTALRQSYSYVLNREHVLVPGLEQVRRSMPTVEGMIRAVVQGRTLAPASLVLFGSAARRDGDADSDVDLLLVRVDTTNAVDGPGRSNATLWLEPVRREEPLISRLRAHGLLLAGLAPAL